MNTISHGVMIIYEAENGMTGQKMLRDPFNPNHQAYFRESIRLRSVPAGSE